MAQSWGNFVGKVPRQQLNWAPCGRTIGSAPYFWLGLSDRVAVFCSFCETVSYHILRLRSRARPFGALPESCVRALSGSTNRPCLGRASRYLPNIRTCSPL